ncbi:MULTISPECIES: type I restriction endonuclease subunit R [unclassified Ectothiorhodospira]|uniref:type I restriction endonuclease subunit R n=1 Tax=unclassified Ectothiorhodospira TaxID=2684909 RepID=UPI001EE936A0|nr:MULTISPECIES: type I restriction endonuclease subunit R [unclassified Ectothiorhodospira]MCG5514730.1 type I restriction endonuclease subunit R [Ectothiorhodospira sp. 9100]MCG5518329.1 type I restriction endonuclease subunit R [Ectothiorhodospira sp. 9905]
MKKAFSEQQVEQAALGWFEALGFDTARGVDISPGVDRDLRASHEQVILESRLRWALGKINPNLPDEAVDQAVRAVMRPPEPTLAQNNWWFHHLLIDGIDVEYRTPDGESRGDKAWLVDFAHPDANDRLIAHQFTVQCGNVTRRPDLVVFLNGLPLVVIELKDPANEQADLWTAYRQLQDYKDKIPLLFAYNVLLAVSDGDRTRVGSLTAGSDRFALWRALNDARAPGEPTLEALIRGLFESGCWEDYVRHAIAFEEDERSGTIIKKVAAYHQFRAVLRARASVKKALKAPIGQGEGRGGVIWHTQGSGKSLTMLMLAGALIGDEQLANPTIVLVTDRNDLDGQLFGTFAAGRALLRQDPEQAESREDLTARLHRASGGVVFTTIQKFEERGAPVSERANIVVLADEAHRSQYGFLDGGARWMRDAIPNATYVGFTGTPLERDDRNTQAVFGDYADVYDMRQAIADDATVPIFYEMRLVKLVPDEQGIREAEDELKEQAAQADQNGQPVNDYVRVELEALAGANARLTLVAQQIVEHFEQRREAIEGKGMAVCMSRQICMDLYDEIIVLRPEWHADADDAGFIKVIMTGSAAEGDRVTQHARTKARREALARRYKDPDDELRLVIVCDMWLTGFDCPPMHTLYLDKPLAGHNLMQAIARVNRVFGDKPGGVVVDFLGIADQLRDAVQTYTQAGGEGSPVEDIQNEAVPLMERQFEALKDFFNGLDYSSFSGGDASAQIHAVTVGADYVFEQEDGKRRFMSMVAGLSKAFALAVPRPETEAIRDELAYFQSVRAAIRKRLADDGPPPAPDNRAAVRQVLSGAIASDGVIDLFQAAGLGGQEVGVLSEEFLGQLAGMPQKNLALETLRKLLNDQIRSRERVNIVQSQGFRESLEATLMRYTNRAITTAQVIEALIGLARTIRDAVHRGVETGLSEDELAFYDALASNESAREFIADDTLRQIAHELVDRIKAKATLDWTQRDTVRADMRRTVRRSLAKYGYPPDAQEATTQLVIRQAELMADNEVTCSSASPVV